MNPNDEKANDLKSDNPKITAQKTGAGPVEALGSVTFATIIALAEHFSTAATAAASEADPGKEATTNNPLSSAQQTRGLL